MEGHVHVTDTDACEWIEQCVDGLREAVESVQAQVDEQKAAGNEAWTRGQEIADGMWQQLAVMTRVRDLVYQGITGQEELRDRVIG